MLGSHVLLPKRLRFSSLGHDGQSVTVSVVAGDEHDEIDEPPQPHTAERDELQNAQNDGAGIESVNAEGTLRINGCTEGFPLHFYEFTRSTQEKTDSRIGPSVLPFSDNLYSTLAGTSANTSRSTSP